MMLDCLRDRTIPDFVTSHPPDDLARHSVEVTTAGGTRTMMLAWIVE
jgi:hypothetical protein